MALHFGQHPDVVFLKAPLIRVLCQIKFPPILSLMTPVGVTGFQTAIRSVYPIMLPPEQAASISVQNETIGIRSGAPIWRFADDNANWTVALAADFMSLETPSYTDIAEFLERVEFAMAAIRRTVRPKDSTRVGFRKVNFISSEEYDKKPELLTGIFRAELLGLLGVKSMSADISASVITQQFADSENELVVRSGLSEYDSRSGFMLDLDYFTMRPYSVDANSIKPLLRYFSDGMTDFFHWALTDSYKEHLKPSGRTREVTS